MSGESRLIVETRLVEPEILDRLAWDDPEAVRARRDLKLINWMMGNDRWICRTILKHRQVAAKGIVELGAGSGALAGTLARLFPGVPVCACDLAPRPALLDARVEWRQGDVLVDGLRGGGGVVVANLFLHHFEGEPLRLLGERCQQFDLLVFSEPDRRRWAEWLALTLWPWIGRVTRHDMRVSIRAGFSPGELPTLLGLDQARWRVDEFSTWRGARRIVAWREG